MKFQIFSAAAADYDRRLAILLSGRTSKGKNVVAVINGFRSTITLVQRSTRSTSSGLVVRLKHELGEIDCTLSTVLQKQFYGWIPDEHGDQTKFWRVHHIHFSSLAERQRAIEYIKSSPSWLDGYALEEDWLSPVSQFWDKSGLVPGCWVKLNASVICERLMNQEEKLFTQTQHPPVAFSVHLTDIHRVEFDGLAPCKIISWDIEAVGAKRGTFPQADRPADHVIAIGNVLRMGEHVEECSFVLLPLCESQEDPQNESVRYFDSEVELITAWQKWCIAMDPDIMMGWNTNGFDWPYLCGRLRTLCPQGSTEEDKFKHNWSRWTRGSKKRVRVGNEYMCFQGRVNLDLMQWLKKQVHLRLQSYKLNNVAKHFLKEEKIDLSPEEIYDAFFSQGKYAGERTREHVEASLLDVVKYCIQDCWLPLKLQEALVVLPQLVEMAKVTYTPLADLINGGQQIKVMNLLTVHAHRAGFFLNMPQDIHQTTPYQGATVLPPRPGYYDTPVSTLDFASLYPSIIRADNLCYSTLVMDPQYVRPGPFLFLNTGPMEAERPPIVFVQHIRGVLPSIVENLLDARRRVKRQLAQCSDPFMQMILDGRQLALKLSANSVYGFTGASGTHALYPCRPVAESITSRGRNMILLTKTYAEKWFTAERLLQSDNEWKDALQAAVPPGFVAPHEGRVIYGDTDSIMFNIPVPRTVAGFDLAWAIANAMSKEISQLFGPAHLLENEKIYYPGVWGTKKKMYYGRCFLGARANPKLDIKGMGVIRRDRFPFIVKLCERLVKIMTWDGLALDAPPPSSAEILGKLERELAAGLDAFINDEIPFEDYILTVGFKAGYKNPDKQVQVRIAQQMQERNPGSEYIVGDRVQFVVVERQDMNPKHLVDHVEHPEFAKNQGIPLDRLYYFEHYAETQIEQLFPGDIFPHLKSMITSYKMRFLNKKNKQSTLVADFPVIVRPRKRKRVKPKVTGRQMTLFDH